MAKFIVTDYSKHRLCIAICEQAGIDPNYVRRMVIDLPVSGVAVIYLEMLADTAQLEVSLADLDIEIKEVENAD